MHLALHIRLIGKNVFFTSDSEHLEINDRSHQRTQSARLDILQNSERETAPRPVSVHVKAVVGVLEYAALLVLEGRNRSALW